LLNGRESNGKLHQSSLGQGFDRGKSISVCDIRNPASRGKIHGFAERDWESAVEKKEGKVINIMYICNVLLNGVAGIQKEIGTNHCSNLCQRPATRWHFLFYEYK
jgi:hypothetical protein